MLDIINMVNYALNYFRNTNFTIEQINLYEGNIYRENYYVYSQDGYSRRIGFYCCNKNVTLTFSIVNSNEVKRFRLHGKDSQTDEYEISPNWILNFRKKLTEIYTKMLEIRDREPKRKEALQVKVQETLEIVSNIFEELTFHEIASKVGHTSPQKLEEIRKIIEDLLLEGKINARIRGDYVVFRKPFETKTVEILTDIKDDTELIKDYTSKIEDLLDKTDDIEAYLKTHLASDYEKIKDKIEDYKKGKIKKKELAKHIIKSLGKAIGKIFIRTV